MLIELSIAQQGSIITMNKFAIFVGFMVFYSNVLSYNLKIKLQN